MVRAVVDSVRSGSDFFERPYIGASFEAVTPFIAESLGMPRPTGALVSSVTPEGPAAEAGLRPGDVILTLNGAPIEHVDALGYRLATQPIDSTAELLVLSRGKEHPVQVKLIRAPEGNSAEEILIRGRSPFAGATVAELSPRLAQRLGLRTETKGVTILGIDRDSPAARLGLKPGDIVREVNGDEIDSADKLQQVAEQQTRWWKFTLERDGRLLRQVLRF
jgi:S1-C subfamily serine protease